MRVRPYETPEIQDELNIIKESVLQVVPDTEAIYIFGSYVYGEPHKDSDLDICVIVPDSAVECERPIEIGFHIRRNYSDKLHFPTDLLVKGSSVFENRKHRQTLDKVIANRGVRFYGDYPLIHDWFRHADNDYKVAEHLLLEFYPVQIESLFP